MLRGFEEKGPQNRSRMFEKTVSCQKMGKKEVTTQEDSKALTKGLVVTKQQNRPLHQRDGTGGMRLMSPGSLTAVQRISALAAHHSPWEFFCCTPSLKNSCGKVQFSIK